MEWQPIVGYVLGVLGIAATVFYASRRPSRRLAWEIVRDQKIRAPGAGPGGYEFQGTAHHVTIRVMNKGREPIQGRDYDEPVTFISRAHAVDAWIGERSTRTINPVATLRDHRLSYEPTLLNPGEWFDLEGRFDDQMGGGQLYFHVHTGRVAGIGELEDWAKRSARVSRVQRQVGLAAGVLLVVAAAFLLASAGLAASRLLAAIAGWVLMYAGLLVVLLVLGVLRPGRLRKPFRREHPS